MSLLDSDCVARPSSKVVDFDPCPRTILSRENRATPSRERPDPTGAALVELVYTATFKVAAC